MSNQTTIELFKEDMKFSAAHFTVFSKTHRENLHGHNYQLYASFVSQVNKDGLAFDYRYFKKILRRLCDELDERVIIPILCPHLTLTEYDNQVTVTFDSETMSLLKRDVKLLAIKNATVEEFATWFIQQLLRDGHLLNEHHVSMITIKISSGPGQSGSAIWHNDRIGMRELKIGQVK